MPDKQESNIRMQMRVRAMHTRLAHFYTHVCMPAHTHTHTCSHAGMGADICRRMRANTRVRMPCICRACVRACVRASERACVRACVVAPCESKGVPHGLGLTSSAIARLESIGDSRAVEATVAVGIAVMQPSPAKPVLVKPKSCDL